MSEDIAVGPKKLQGLPVKCELALPSLYAGVTGKRSQPVGLEYDFMPLPPYDPCRIGIDAIIHTYVSDQ